ncbi:carbohydrate ABC transporter membrane protein 2, CUT1 family [Pedococcus dokdonensis]|uniref:Carbohydrate ABC transporter membrane protein 2, CUT1 family n=1 Tax=Pedococcus dokdonensis TaxID=443156 RepID=A0A1H0TW24_9MICO|nr:carbohydrate ABC transporter permease [Pedococcus dokdonensis]SDP58322.1 carbohydrate ABC transporter membrane protein 2, CUT1 family [Pedococcus dokdonensis]
MRTKSPTRVAQYAALLAYVVFLGFPLLWLFSTAFKSPSELTKLTPTVFPTDWTLGNFDRAFEQTQLWSALRNSLVVAVATAVITTLIALPASYALARFKSRLRSVTIGWILVSQVFPFILIVIPVFIVLRNLGLINTLVGLVIVYVVWALPFTLWMLQGYVAAIPRDLEEAASTDGASRFVILRSIIFPLLMPGLVATSMFAFISAWNEFFFALVIIQDPALQTAPLLLARYVGAEGSVNLGPLAATALVTTLPSLVVFAIAQRRLVSGMLSGSVKG